MLKKLVTLFLLSSTAVAFANKGPVITINNLTYLGCDAAQLPTCAQPPYSQDEDFIKNGEVIQYTHSMEYRKADGNLTGWTSLFYVNNAAENHSFVIDFSIYEGTEWRFTSNNKIMGTRYAGYYGSTCDEDTLANELNKYLVGSAPRITIDVTLDEELVWWGEMIIVTKCTVSAASTL